uniref:SAP domain-containing protein n=1 Tax=Craspedostauros australis TaxID=1486917 RepID=A0A7R9ZMH0_9STRA
MNHSARPSGRSMIMATMATFIVATSRLPLPKHRGMRLVEAFQVSRVPHVVRPTTASRQTSRLFSSTSLPEISAMRAGEIKKELESYGVSTKAFLEKSELVSALKKARSDGMTPKAAASTASTTADAGTSSSSGTAAKQENDDGRPREIRLQEEMDKCKAMKASELKKELEERGVSTKTFFEKSEFVKALAEARVDGVQKKDEEETVYADVEVLTDDSSGPRAKSSDQQQQQQQQQRIHHTHM